MRFVYFLLIGILLRPALADESKPQPQAKIVATLQHVKSKPQSPRSVPLRLTVENIGDTSAAIVRLRSRDLETYGFSGGWSIHIDGPNGQWAFIAAPISSPPFSDAMLIELLPGESFGLLIDVGPAALRKQPITGNDNVWLFETKGEYTITVSYSLSKELLPLVKRENVSIEPVHSNVVKLTIER